MPSPITTLAQLTSQQAALYAPVAAANAAVAAQHKALLAAQRDCVTALKLSRKITSLMDSATGVRIAPDSTDHYAVAQAAERAAQASYMAAVHQALAAYHIYAQHVLPRYQELVPVHDAPA